MGWEPSCGSAARLRRSSEPQSRSTSRTSSWRSGCPASSLGEAGGLRSSSSFYPLSGDCTPLPGALAGSPHPRFPSSQLCLLPHLPGSPSEEFTSSPHPRTISLWTQVVTHGSEVSSLPGAPRMCPPSHRGPQESCQPQRGRRGADEGRDRGTKTAPSKEKGS